MEATPAQPTAVRTATHLVLTAPDGAVDTLKLTPARSRVQAVTFSECADGSVWVPVLNKSVAAGAALKPFHRLSKRVMFCEVTEG